MMITPLLHTLLIDLRRSDVTFDEVLDVRHHLDAALDWIRRASAVTADGGVSKGYDLLRGRWAPSYPETTGYTVPTLLNAASILGRPELESLALSLADYLLRQATPEGGVVHWTGANPYPIVFDTGQTMFGWLTAYEASGEERYLDAARRAGDWLVAVQDRSGAWKAYQHLGVEKVIDTRVAWALLELHGYTQDLAYQKAAVRNLDWALKHQDADGWFRRCAFTEKEDPFTHTLAYTAEGLFECGRLLGDMRDAGYVDAARRTADALLRRQRDDGRLASAYGPGWRETSRSSCLTGNCQMAHLWLRLYEMEGDRLYRDAARKAIAFVAGTQNLETPNQDVRGGIAGSYPIYGRYERLKYPNWATKFFVDALLALDRVENGHDTPYVG